MVARAVRLDANTLRIGELARATGYTDKTLRYYESIGLLEPKGRTSSGYRIYGLEAIERLQFVRNAQNLGLSLSAIEQILSITDAGGVACEHVLSVIDHQLHQIASQLEALNALQRQLRSVRRRVIKEIATGPTKSGQGCGCRNDVKAPARRVMRPSSRRV